MLNRTTIIDVFIAKLSLNLKAESSRTYFGYVWWVLEPALYVLVLYLVFTVLLSRGMELFVAFLLCGTIPYLWFSKSITKATGAIMDAHGLISSVHIPKAFFPLLVICQDFVKQGFVFILFFIFLLLYGVEPKWSWFFTIPIILTQSIFIIGTGLLASAITPFFPDFKFFVPTGTMLLMFASGLFYSYEMVIPEEYWSLFLANPMANLINNYRMVILDGLAPHWLSLFFIGTASALLGGLVVWVLRRTESVYSRLVMQ